MNANEGFVFPNNLKNLENEDGGFNPQHVMKTNTEEGDPTSTSKGPTGLGLKGTMTSSTDREFNKMKMCPHKENKSRKENEGLNSNHAKTKAKSDKLKAGCFPATNMQIGAWQRTSRQDGDLIVKFYYYQRKLIWEVLEGSLKSKMEIRWSDICAIRAKTLDNKSGMLEIELIRPPLYSQETCPRPKKHSIWKWSSDFTSGQATSFRRHQVTFPPGILEKNYEQLQNRDKELYSLSEKPFPRHMSPYFTPLTPYFSCYGANQATHFPYLSYPTTLPREPLSWEIPNSSPSVLDIPITYQGGKNNNYVAQYHASWPQSLSIPKDNFDIHGTSSISSTTMNISNVYDPPLHSTTNDNNVYDLSHHDPNTLGPLTDINDDFLDKIFNLTMLY